MVQLRIWSPCPSREHYGPFEEIDKGFLGLRGTVQSNQGGFRERF